MGYIILFAWLILLPLCVGGIFRGMKQFHMTAAACWCWGQFILWAVFQPIAVYYILTYGHLSDLGSRYMLVAAGLAAVGICTHVYHTRKAVLKGKSLKENSTWTGQEKLLAGLFVLLWLVQMLAILFLAVNDGDDAYYMAVANIAESSDVMYTMDAYSYGAMGLNYRYVLAPLPIWIAFLSRISGVHTLIIGHIILGMILITMSYIICSFSGQILFGTNRKKYLLFMNFLAVLYIWGNTSSHTAESFLLTRSRQGKALVAGIVFPAMICLLLYMGKVLEEQQSIAFRNYLLAAAVILTGCLGSTLGGSLVILLWGSAVFLLAVGYRKWSMLPLGMFSAAPGVVYALLYLVQ